MRIVALMAATALALAGCAGITTFTVDDLERGIAIAAAANDVDGVACGQELLAYVQTIRPPQAPVGFFSGLMSARQIRRSRDQGIPDAVRRACAVVVLDAERTLVRLGLRFTPGGSALGALLPR